MIAGMGQAGMGHIWNGGIVQNQCHIASGTVLLDV